MERNVCNPVHVQYLQQNELINFEGTKYKLKNLFQMYARFYLQTDALMHADYFQQACI